MGAVNGQKKTPNQTKKPTNQQQQQKQQQKKKRKKQTTLLACPSLCLCSHCNIDL